MGRLTVVAVKPLLVYAAPIEGASIAAALPVHRFAELGVGMARAAMNLTRALFLGPPPPLVIGFGFAGAYPASEVELAVGAGCLVSREVFADEGVETGDGFLDLAKLGFADAAELLADARATRAAATALGVPVVAGATVASCSGTDVRAAALVKRARAQVETMEGAAVALVCARFGVPWIELRVVSNRCGEREQAGFDIARARAKLGELVPKLVGLELV